MTVRRTASLVPIIVAVWASLAWPLLAEAPAVGLLLFRSANCPSCQVVQHEILSPLEEEYGEQMEVRIFNPALPDDYGVLLKSEQELDVRLRRVPALFIGKAFLEGEEAIREHLPDLVRDCAANGGCPLAWDGQSSAARELVSMSPPPQLLQRVSSRVPGVVGYTGTEAECPSCLFGADPVSAAYFYRGSNWPEEEWSWFAMRYWLEHRQNLGVRTLDVDYPDNEALWVDLCRYYELSDECVTPVVFLGAHAFLDEQIETSRLVAAWKEYSGELMPAPWQLLEEGRPRPEPRGVAANGQSAAGAERSLPTQTEPGAVAHAAFFFSPTCPHCKVVEEEVLPPLRSKYGSQLEIRELNVREPRDYEVLLDLEAHYGVHVAEVPVIFIGDAVLEGEEAIRNTLDAQIESCLQAGGCAFPGEHQPSAEMSAAESTRSSAVEEELGPGVTAYQGTGSEGAGRPAVPVAYFFEQGCQVCDRAWYDLRHLLGQYGNLYLRVYDISTPESKVLHEAMSQHYGVPEDKHLSTPALFVGDHYFLGHDITLQGVEAAYQEYSTKGSPAPWELAAGQTAQARTRIVDRFRSFGLYTVVAAGLIDGLNPCAFATIILFISYLAISGRRGREVLTVGAAFTLGVFLAYLLVGIGLWRLLQSLDFLASLGRWVYLITGLICLILAVLSILDYRKARRGELEEMTLSLPHSMRMRINKVIRQSRQARAFVWAAFITGLAVSIIELACTGQVYLPTIIFVMGVPELRVRAFLYLLLYNLMFILPLVVVFILAFRGTTSKQLTRFLQVRAATVKLAMSGLFFALSGWLLYTVFWG